jgi:type IV secretory pathway protease TraF
MVCVIAVHDRTVMILGERVVINGGTFIQNNYIDKQGE